MWQAALAGAGLGLLKSREDKKAAERERAAQAQIAAYSPWTGMQGHTVQDPSMLGGVMQGASAGLGLGQAYDMAASQDAMNQKQGQLIDAQTNAINNGSAGSYNAYAGQSPWVEGPARPPIK